MDGQPDRADPGKWRPLIMSFRHFYGLGSKLHNTTLAQIPEAQYRGPEILPARAVPPIGAARMGRVGVLSQTDRIC
jgi:hypothetical protein